MKMKSQDDAEIMRAYDAILLRHTTTGGENSSNDVPSSMGREECYRELESMGIEIEKFNEFLEGRLVHELPLLIDMLRLVGSNNPDPVVLNLFVAASSSGVGIPSSMGTVDEIHHKLKLMGIEKCESMGIDKREFIDSITAREKRRKTALTADFLEEGDDDDVDKVIVDAASFSVGDSVQIMGLVSAPQYNDVRGIVVSDFDRTTNRCGVKVHGGKGPILALQVHNLTMIRKAKKSSSVDVKFPLHVNFDDTKHSIAVVNKAERSKLQQLNMAILHDFGAHADSVNFGAHADSLNFGALHAPTKCIIRKWSKQAFCTGFIRFLNGITTDCRVENMLLVSLRDALVNIDQWKVDWDKNLELSEIKLVKDPTWRRVFLRSTGVDVRNSAHDISSLQMTTPTPSTDYGLTTINPYADSHSTKQVAKVMKDFRKCKKVAVNLLRSNLGGDEDELNSFQQALIDNGLLSVLLGFLSQCEHEDFNDVVNKVKGNLRTPADWMEILMKLSTFKQCKVEIANGIQAVLRCMCDDNKRLFFKSNKYWHEAMPTFAALVSDLLSSSDDLSTKVTASTVCHILLQNEGFLESIVHRCFWTSYRPDLVKEYESHQPSVDVKSLESFAHMGIKNIHFIGLDRNKTETDEELNRLTVPEAFSQDGLDLITTIAKTPVVSRAHDPRCKVNYVVGMIRMLKIVDSVDRRDQFSVLNSMFAYNADYVDNGIIAEVIELGSKFIASIDDAVTISELSYSMLVRRAQGHVYPIDKRLAFAIKSGLLDMCVEFIMRFACDPTIQLLARDAQRDELMRRFVCIAEFIHAVGFHQKTAKAIRDHRSQIIEALSRLSAQVKTEQTTKFVDLLSSIMDLNVGSCSCCNKPIEWHTALFCGGCRRVAYCGKKCQKKDWRHGTHSSDCSFLARSADVMGLTTFEVKSSRNKSMLTGLRNNIVTSQKKLFLRHEVSIMRLLTLPDRSDYIAVFDHNNQHPVSIAHYHEQFACSKQRAWFEEFRSPDKVICMFASDVFNGEFDDEGRNNEITLWACFSTP
jgi:hypothetical protein